MYTTKETYVVQDIYEINSGISLTEPDMSLSIKEILVRHSRGLSLPVEAVHDVQYSGSQLHPLSRKGLDLADLPKIHRENGEVIDSLKAKLEEESRKDVPQSETPSNTPEPTSESK